MSARLPPRWNAAGFQPLGLQRPDCVQAKGVSPAQLRGRRRGNALLGRAAQHLARRGEALSCGSPYAGSARSAIGPTFASLARLLMVLVRFLTGPGAVAGAAW
jgi:hypothetical protein